MRNLRCVATGDQALDVVTQSAIGDAWCWGNGALGQLGDGDTGRIQCWGSNLFGQLGDGSRLTSDELVTVVGLPAR